MGSRTVKMKLKRLIGFVILMGILGGLTALLLSFLVDFFTFTVFEFIGGVNVPRAPGEPAFFESITVTLSAYHFLPIIAIIGGLITGFIVYRFAEETEGSGLDQIMGTFHNKKGKTRRRVPLVKLFASAITIGVGGSAGKEGPAGQIGGSLGSIMADKFGLSSSGRELMLLVGAAACLGAIFKAPFGAAFFIVEVLYIRDYEVEAFMPAIVATFLSYGVYASVIGWQPLFNAPIYDFIPAELPLFILLGLLCGVIGIVFIKFFYYLKNKVFKPMNIPRFIKPGLGMIFIALILVFFPYAAGTGYGYIQMTIDGTLPIQIIVILIFMKIASTSFTVGSGGSGGDFAPSLVIGGLIGGAFSFGMQNMLPTIVTQQGIFVLVGMGSFISAIANTPVAAIIMVSEMTGSYTVLAPAIIASVASYAISYKWSIYDKQLPDRTYSFARISSLLCDVLTHIKVSKIMTTKFNKISTTDAVKKIEELCKTGKQHSFPVVDENDEIIGVIGCRDIVKLSKEEKEKSTAGDIAKKEFISILPTDDAKIAFHKLATSGLSMIPVVDPTDKKKLLGMVARDDIEKIMEL